MAFLERLRCFLLLLASDVVSAVADFDLLGGALLAASVDTAETSASSPYKQKHLADWFKSNVSQSAIAHVDSSAGAFAYLLTDRAHRPPSFSWKYVKQRL